MAVEQRCIYISIRIYISYADCIPNEKFRYSSVPGSYPLINPTTSLFLYPWSYWYDTLKTVQGLTAMGVAREEPVGSDRHSQKGPK